MIEKMKKLDVLLYHAEKDAFLRALQHAGVVHVQEGAGRESAPVLEISERIRKIESSIAELRAAPVVPDAAQTQQQDTAAVVARIETLRSDVSQAEQQLTALQKEAETVRQWGAFDSALIDKLRAVGIEIRLYRFSRKQVATADFGAMGAEIITEDSAGAYVAIVGRDAPAGIDAEAVPFPRRSVADVEREIAQVKQRIEVLRREMSAMKPYAGALSGERGTLVDMREFLAASADTEALAGERVVFLGGWYPVVKEKEVQAVVSKFTAHVTVREALAGDNVPVLLRNGPFAAMFEPVLKLLSLPDYYEIDPVPFFAPFLAVFIGLCLGDIGYGGILLIASLIFRGKVSAAIRPALTLVSVVSVFMVLAGFALNSFFGSTLFGGEAISGAILPFGARYFAPLSPFDGPKGTIYPMMSFSIVLGIVQVFLAVILRAINNWRNDGPASAIFPLSWIPMFFGFLVFAANTSLFGLRWENLAAGKLMVGRLFLIPGKTGGLAMMIGGLALFMLFNNPSSAIWIRPLKGLWELFNFLTGMLSSILSYLRLFAIGLASGLLGNAFTTMALMLVRREDGSLNFATPLVVFSLLILVGGHSLNLVLSIVSSIIHPLRLTFVEFLFNNLGFKGGSRPYQPLSLTAKKP